MIAAVAAVVIVIVIIIIIINGGSGGGGALHGQRRSGKASDPVTVKVPLPPYPCTGLPHDHTYYASKVSPTVLSAVRPAVSTPPPSDD